jgi:hypothetical protein
MEVKLVWLEPVSDDEGAAHPPEAEAVEPPRSSRRKPPRLPGAKITLPPMPIVPSDGPTPHRTMEVEMNWLEIVDESTHAPKRASTRPVPVEEAIRPRKKPSKPIPRED